MHGRRQESLFGDCVDQCGVVDSKPMNHDGTDIKSRGEEPAGRGPDFAPGGALDAAPKRVSGDARDGAPAGRVLALVADLMFDSRIRAAAKNRGVAATSVRSPGALTDSLESSPVDLVIVDLDAHAESVQAVDAIRSRWPTIPVLAFGSHVNESLLQAARDAGAERVWPRSRFSSSLDAVMEEQARRHAGT